MSEISLYSGLYETIRRWADLIDDALVNLKTGKYDDSGNAYAELYKLFSSLAQVDDAQADFSDRRVATIIENKLHNKVDWLELSNNLKDLSRQETIISTLEAIARCLAEKHADTVAKMRWGHP